VAVRFLDAQVTASVLLTTASAIAFAQAPTGKSVPVTVDNFARAESDLYMGRTVKDGGLGQFTHNRTPTEIDKQNVIRMNRDTLYSAGVFDLDAGPVTITLPNAGKRFMSLQAISEDHYVPVVMYGSKPVTLSREIVGTRYVLAAVRTLVDPSDAKDLQEVHALQDGIKVSQKGAGNFEVPSWDEASQKKVRDALLILATTTGGFKNAFGAKGQVDPVRHLIATAAGWGGNPDKDAAYLSFTPAKNDGETVYKLRVGQVPVRLLVHQRLQCRWLLPEKRPQHLLAEQHHGRERSRRLRQRAIRWLRWAHPELHPHHEGMELHGPALSPAL
jgi:hypothetical protein